MIIKKLTQGDYDAALALYSQLDRIHYETRPDYFGKRDVSFPPKAYKESLVDPNCLLLGAFEDNKLLGIVEATLLNKSGMIEGVKTASLDNIYVLPEARRKGVAKALFLEVEAWARRKGAVRLDLHVWDFNQDALNLYRCMGMEYQYHVMEKQL